MYVGGYAMCECEYIMSTNFFGVCIYVWVFEAFCHYVCVFKYILFWNACFFMSVDMRTLCVLHLRVHVHFIRECMLVHARRNGTPCICSCIVCIRDVVAAQWHGGSCTYAHMRWLFRGVLSFFDYLLWLQIWDPWWLHSGLVVPVNERDAAARTHRPDSIQHDTPAIVRGIQPLRDLTSKVSLGLLCVCMCVGGCGCVCVMRTCVRACACVRACDFQGL
jgi:hypothetical protein